MTYQKLLQQAQEKAVEFDKEERTVETSKCGVMVEGHGNSTLGRTNLM